MPLRLWRSAPLYRGLERVSKRKSEMQGSGNADFMPTQHNVIEKQQAIRTVFSVSYQHHKMRKSVAPTLMGFWDYSVYSYFGIGITEYTEYQFPIEKIARYSENRIADVIKRDRRGRAIFPPKYYSVHSAIGSRMNGISFCSFRNRNSSQTNTSTVYSGIGINGIVPKERALSEEMLRNFQTEMDFAIRSKLSGRHTRKDKVWATGLPTNGDALLESSSNGISRWWP